MELNFDFNKIDLNLLKTDKDFRQEAKKRLDQVIIDIGETLALENWQGLATSTSTSKNQFIRLAGQDFKNNLNRQERKNIENLIYETLKNMKKMAA
jgi:hypothetical protein